MEIQKAIEAVEQATEYLQGKKGHGYDEGAIDHSIMCLRVCKLWLKWLRSNGMK